MQVILIDANALIHRLYHALPPLSNKEGQPVGALYGLAVMLLKIIRERQPQYLAAFFDRPEPTFRKKIFNQYKSHRPKIPDTLIQQIIEARELFSNFNIKTFELAGFEADDLIGTCVQKINQKYSNTNIKIIIITGDLDILQIVDNNKVVVETLKRGISETFIYNEKAVIERYGILPKKLPAFKGLVGDTSDNIPGVPGIGPKTASLLLKKYDNLENFFQKGQNEKYYEKILPFREQSLLSENLATIECNAPLSITDLEDLRYQGFSLEQLKTYLEKKGFISLIQKL
jgi:DNA polymerase-1